MHTISSSCTYLVNHLIREAIKGPNSCRATGSELEDSLQSTKGISTTVKMTFQLLIVQHVLALLLAQFVWSAGKLSKKQTVTT